jgi:hypothetical protein
VYAEATDDAALDAYTTGESAVDEALQEGWLKVTASPSYSNPDIPKVMDQARRLIANASDRPEDIVEKPDTEIVGLALEMLLDGVADQIIVVTNDVPLGEAAETLIPQYGFDDEQVEWPTGGELAAELAEDFVPAFE